MPFLHQYKYCWSFEAGDNLINSCGKRNKKDHNAARQRPQLIMHKSMGPPSISDKGKGIWQIIFQWRASLIKHGWVVDSYVMDWGGGGRANRRPANQITSVELKQSLGNIRRNCSEIIKKHTGNVKYILFLLTLLLAPQWNTERHHHFIVLFSCLW